MRERANSGEPGVAGRPVVAYLTARDGVPPRVGRSWDIITAGDGVWLATDNPHLSLRVPVARCRIKGLAPIGPACELRHGPIPQALWDEATLILRWHATAGREHIVLVMVGAGGAYRLVEPQQTGTACRVAYEIPYEEGWPLLQLHSHHTMRAYFSGIDDVDEGGLGLYGVVGRLDRPRGEVALRAGAYGQWLPLAWDAAVAGAIGPFRDLVAAAVPGPAGPDAEGGPDSAGGEGPDGTPAEARVSTAAEMAQTARRAVRLVLPGWLRPGGGRPPRHR